LGTTKWQYVGKMQLPSPYPSVLQDEWETTLKGERARILANMKTKIPSETAFKDRIGDASADQFEAFLATVGGAWDRDTILMKQRAKLYRQYAQWLANIDSAFASGGAFDINVTSKKGKLALARYTLGVVGLRYDPSAGLGVWNPAVMGALLLAGDTRPARYFDANDAFSGVLESVCDAMKGRLGRPPLIAETVKTSIYAKFADEAGLTALRDTLITNGNARLDDFVQPMLNATHKGAGYDVTWVLAWDAGITHCSLTVTDVHP